MRRSLTGVVIVLVALLIPVSASAAKKYVGDLEHGGTVRFKVVRDNHGHKVVRRFRWSNMRINCNDGDHTYDATFVPMRVNRKNKFGYTAVTPNRLLRGIVRGKVRRRKAYGWINVDGRIRHDDGVSDGCYAGYHEDWHAKRVF
jgi:hypothetical protein